MRLKTRVILSAAIAAGFTGSLRADFIPGLMVMQVGGTTFTASNSISIQEYSSTTANTTIGGSIAIPDSGPNAVSMTTVLDNHDRHLRLSTDGQYLAFGAYGAAPSNTDPSTLSSASTPRVIGLVKSDGTVDVSTRLTDAYDATVIRGAFTTNGTNIWVSGDNNGGITTSGGIRFTTKGGSTTANLSHVQTTGGSPTTDNVRDNAIFDGQLYDSSGSSSSIGKAVFTVGGGSPQSGSQTQTNLTTDGASVSSFFFLDADPNTAGVDTLYTGTSTGQTLRKYNLVGGVWQARGQITGGSDIEQVVAGLNADGTASLFFVDGGETSVYKITDSNPYGGSLSGGLPSAFITAPAGFTFGGIALVPEPSSLGLCALAAGTLVRRRRISK
ncbi:MAG TPA: PEP-CTERM sorting domain-containing protein [Tepidisphaeraceae bacterium]|nr:PEP-CTERM sorting domain-containing protein [Tepidisphaeraceae bacterium]